MEEQVLQAPSLPSNALCLTQPHGTTPIQFAPGRSYYSPGNACILD